jgi:hypothetical protein
MKNQRHNTDSYVWIGDSEEKFAPPTLPGLMLSSVGNEVFLSIAERTETHESMTIKTLAEVSVDVSTLINGLRAVIDTNQFEAVFHLFEKTKNPYQGDTE